MAAEKSGSRAPSKAKKFAIRTASTLTLITLFVSIMWAGHIPCAALMFTFQAMIVRELFQLARNIDEDKSMPLFRTKQWSFFFVATFYLYGRFIRKNFAATLVGSHSRLTIVLAWVLSRHLLISYGLYTFALVLFVLTLQQDKYRYQFRQLAWSHLIVFFTVVPSSFFVPLMFEGLAWFCIPSALVIVNDIMAYLAGISFGRTPLIKLSPKKTVEGFVGGAIGTMVASFALTWIFAQFQWMYCPREELAFGRLDCARPAPWLPSQYHLSDMSHVLPDFVVEDLRPLLHMLPATVQDAVTRIAWTCMPAQMHAVALAAFASLIGPFGAFPLLVRSSTRHELTPGRRGWGGFFASGFKRALGVKDFGSSIPGHGGITDRFDCQMPMAVFSYIYFHLYIAQDQASEEVLDGLMDMSSANKLRVFTGLGTMLVADGLVNNSALQRVLGGMNGCPSP